MSVPMPLIIAAFDTTLRFVLDLAVQHSQGQLTDEEYEERVHAITDRAAQHVSRAHASWDASVQARGR